MKRYIFILVALTAMLFGASCRRDCLDVTAPSEGQGLACFNIGVSNVTRTRSVWDECNIRIYKVTYTADDADKQYGRRELVRHYLSLEDMPSELWLAEGDYSIDVIIGNENKRVSAEPCYHGETAFTIKSGLSTPVEVLCRIRNTIVKVNFDESVTDTFDVGYKAVIMPGKTFDEASADDETAAVVCDADNERGYFVIDPANAFISFCFKGESTDPTVYDSGDNHGEGTSAPGEIHEHYNGYALNAAELEGYCYEINFRYSPDAEGFIAWDIEITVDDTEDFDDIVGVNPAPKPVITGEGTDPDGEAFKTAGDLQYTVTASDRTISKVEISVDGGESLVVDCRSEGDKEGGVNIAYEDESGKIVTVTLKSDFFNDRLAGGEHMLHIKAYTNATTFGETDARIFTPGAFLITPVDKWNATGEMRGYLFSEPEGEVKIRYRLKQNSIATENDGEEWTVVNAAKESGEVYFAEGVEVHADAYYEYQLMVGDRVVGAAKKEVTENGVQIPNAGFETWSNTKDGKAKIPYLLEEESTNQWWDTGNHGSATMNINITTNETAGIRAGSPGKTYAKLASRYVVLKFAAGNIFVGKYAGTSGTDGVIAFGKPFSFDYKPRALRFWYKSTVGAINRGSGAPGVKTGDPDPNEIYVMLCNMEGPHIVNTSDKTTLVDLTSHTISYCSASSFNANSKNDQSDGHVIASAVWNNTDSQSEWKMVELELKYNDEYNSEKPTYLMLTASASKYGDYFMGCDSNVLSLDDIELVY